MTLLDRNKDMPDHLPHEAPVQQDYFRTMTYISGHRHPDTDSIVSAMAYEALKSKLGESALAVRLGEINPETAMVLNRFNLSAPPALADIRTQIRDLQIDHPTPMSPDISLWKAWDQLQDEQTTQSLPVADKEGHFLGMITGGDIAAFDMRQIQEASTKTTITNLISTLNGEHICGPETSLLLAPIYVAGLDCSLHKDGIVLAEYADENMILRAEDSHVLCLVVCNVTEPKVLIKSLSFPARSISHTAVVSSPYGLYQTLRLITLSTPVSTVMHSDKIERFGLKDYLDDVRNAMLSSRFRSYPVVDASGHVAGLISRYHLIRPSRKRVILVDHNEMAQSFPGLEQAEIVEIIDHHRIGDVTTDGPIYVRNEPVGSTSTIITSMYFENNVFIDRPIAGILLAAILSDTIFFKSPTCTPKDRDMAQKLSILSGENIDLLAGAMFTPNESLLKMTAKELLNMDFKVFRMAGAKVAIAQISAMDISGFLSRQDELLAQMDIDRKLEDYDMIMMALTDIEKGGSQILVSGSLGDALERAYGDDVKGRNSFYLPGVMSRKKQIVPQLSMVVSIG